MLKLKSLKVGDLLWKTVQSVLKNELDSTWMPITNDLNMLKLFQLFEEDEDGIETELFGKGLVIKFCAFGPAHGDF